MAALGAWELVPANVVKYYVDLLSMALDAPGAGDPTELGEHLRDVGQVYVTRAAWTDAADQLGMPPEEARLFLTETLLDAKLKGDPDRRPQQWQIRRPHEISAMILPEGGLMKVIGIGKIRIGGRLAGSERKRRAKRRIVDQ